MSILTDTTRDVLAQAHVDGLTRDQAIIILVTDHSHTLNKATKAYAEWAKEEGIAPTLTSHKDEVLTLLRGAYPKGKGWDAEAVKARVITLADEYGVAESTARDYCKAYSEELGVTHPVLDPKTAIFEWFRDNRQLDVDAMKEAYMKFATGELKRSKSNANEYWKGYELHMYLNDH